VIKISLAVTKNDEGNQRCLRESQYNFEAGLGQEMRYPIDFNEEFGIELLNSDEDHFPAIIEIISIGFPDNSQKVPAMEITSQMTYLTFAKQLESVHTVKVARQSIQFENHEDKKPQEDPIEKGEVEEVFSPDGEEGGSDCVICMSEIPDTIVYPCRHLCLCSTCSETFRIQAPKCPICRAPVHNLIKVCLEKSRFSDGELPLGKKNSRGNLRIVT